MLENKMKKYTKLTIKINGNKKKNGILEKFRKDGYRKKFNT